MRKVSFDGNVNVLQEAPCESGKRVLKKEVRSRMERGVREEACAVWMHRPSMRSKRAAGIDFD
eukprot:724882-Ditylum_brightwellii.AAC.1